MLTMLLSIGSCHATINNLRRAFTSIIRIMMTSLLYLRKSSNYFYTLPVYLRTSHYCLHSARCMRLPEPGFRVIASPVGIHSEGLAFTLHVFWYRWFHPKWLKVSEGHRSVQFRKASYTSILDSFYTLYPINDGSDSRIILVGQPKPSLSSLPYITQDWCSQCRWFRSYTAAWLWRGRRAKLDKVTLT